MRSALRAFIRNETSGGIVLMVAAALALAISNSPAAEVYFETLHLPVLGLSLEHWINDGLMAVFFLLVGLEIKREMLDGHLSTWSRRALPGLAAVGGMVVPALIYVAVNSSNPETLRGWAIPAATDIAFALGVLSLLGRRVPISLKVFLTALAIIDDLGAILIIAVFYTAEISVAALGAAAAVTAVLVLLNRMRIKHLAPYLGLGALLWWLMLNSGIHATLAGVVLALTIPVHPTPGRVEARDSPLHQLEHALQPWVAFAVIPIFGFANAGVALGDVGIGDLADSVPLGVALGLFVGKQLGVFAFSWAAIRIGWAELPANASWKQLYGVCVLCGIGFTMSLFIGLLAFPGAPLLIDEVKIGVLMGSMLSAVAGILLLMSCRSREFPRVESVD